MVEVELNSRQCDIIINWYIHKFGKGINQATQEEVVLLHKMETMRDALFVDEEMFKDLTK